MYKSRLIFGLVLSIIMSDGNNIQGNVMDSQHYLMPVPESIKFGNGKFRLNNDFRVDIAADSGSRSYPAATRMLRRLSGRTGLFIGQGFVTPEQLDAIAVFQIKSQRLGAVVLGEDESYTLSVTPEKILLTAPTDLGVLHGLETLLQLMETDREGYYFPVVVIEDQPRFPWRGLMIDVCRHFQPLEVIKRNLDAMAALKLNVLHLHLSEDQGFRIESKHFPRLHEMGSDGSYFTQDQIRELIDYADKRGIRVLPEFDMPSHSTSWFVGYPHLASIDSIYTIERKWGIKDPAMDPSKESTYEFLDAFIGEMATLFPDAYFHIGGDENNGVQWGRNPEIQAFMRSQGFETTHELQSYFIKRIQNIVAGHGKIMIGWDEIFDPEMPGEIVTQFWSWKGMNKLESALAQGYKAIISNGYYIDLFWSAERHYLLDPLREGSVSDVSLEKNILGGEVPNWTEFVTPELIDARIWPRTAAIAERFWSPAKIRDVEDMYHRLERVSYHLEELGLNHIKNRDMLLRHLANNGDITALRHFVNVVEPIEDYTRHFFNNEKKYTSYSPLTRIVDAADSDAMTARKFRSNVEDFIDYYSSIQQDVGTAGFFKKRKLMQQVIRSEVCTDICMSLKLWRDNHGRLKPVIDSSPVLREIEDLSKTLSRVSSIGLEAIGYMEAGKRAPQKWIQASLKYLEAAAEPQAEVEIRILSAVERLVKTAGGQSKMETP